MSREDPPFIPEPLAEDLAKEFSDEKSPLQEADLLLRGSLGWAGHDWGEPRHLLWAARGAAEKVTELSALLNGLRRVLNKPGASSKEILAEVEDSVRLQRALHKELNELCGWGDESLLHAYAHIRPFILNLKADLSTEKFLREHADRLVRVGEREKIVDWIRKGVELEKKHNLLILGGSDNSELRAQLRMAENLADSIENCDHEKKA